ncbi:uncharacterized protein LOC135205153 [Macrobrachium nipponense]|uniref:uncharacterized protein LOC135205153 n=1 Tax=Macrobrachium nipponense TaxID=159736 RepID=UPI0030C88A42
MPVRDQNPSRPSNKSRNGMFKWMISGHKGHKHKQEKLNNAVLNNKNKNNLKQQQQQQQHHEQQQNENQEDQTNHPAQQQQELPQQQQLNTVLHISEPTSNGDTIQNLDKCDEGPSGGRTPGPRPSPAGQQSSRRVTPEDLSTQGRRVSCRPLGSRIRGSLTQGRPGERCRILPTREDENGRLQNPRPPAPREAGKGASSQAIHPCGASSEGDAPGGQPQGEALPERACYPLLGTGGSSEGRSRIQDERDSRKCRQRPGTPSTSAHPPPPPSHPPPPVPSHPQGFPHPPQQPLPPVPGHHEDNAYQHERLLQAPGTCTLPRRGLVREDPSTRFRSPSNPPPASRQPPPYSRHQPPDPIRRVRGPYQPPPPPKIDNGDSRDHARDHWDPRGSRDLCNPREPRERDFGRFRERHGGGGGHSDFPNPRDRNLQESDKRDNWDRRDMREPYDAREHRKSRNFQDILDTWEKRESKVHLDHHHEEQQHRSSSLPRGNYDNWISKTNRWSSRDPDSGFDSLNNPSIDAGPHSLDSVGGLPGHQSRCAIPINHEDVPYSQSTEDLLNASRTSPDSISSTPASSASSSPIQYPTIRPAKQPCIGSALHHSPNPLGSSHPSPHSPSASSPLALGSPHHHSTPVGPPRPPSPDNALLSDSVYPQHDGQPRYAEIPDVKEPRDREEEPKNQRVSRDLRDARDVLEMRDERDGKAAKNQRDVRNNGDVRNNHDPRAPTRVFRDTSLPRDLRDYRDSRNVLEVREDRLSHDRDPRGFRELSVDGDDHDPLDNRCDVSRGRRDSRQYSAERTELPKEVRFSKDPSEGLRVRDAPSYERRDRDADGADDLQVTEQRRGSISHSKERQIDSRKGDGATASSVSWMEWTQQLQAYVAWVNSQLRKRGRPLITDLRRDLQSGEVFADLIEIISGERVAGISRDGNTVQTMRENLERILQFMAAKRIRMTHITSKEVVEGNLKSIMRIILALAAHYKPQSVKSSASSNVHSQQQQDTASASSRQSHPMPATHDIGVGPDAPVTSVEKTPNLSANRRAIMTGCANDDSGGGIVGLRRHPSMNAAQGPVRDSSPVYENLPRRTAQNRWAYDSLRPSHKFQWTASQAHQRNGPPAIPPKSNLDESSDDPLNSSFNASLTNSLNTSLNTSLDGDVEVSSPRHDSGGRGPIRPGGAGFWQDISARRDSNTASPDQQSSSQNQNSADDPDNPFRYHTIHRMSGRRKLPQIPGAASCPSGSRTSGREESEGSRGALGDSPADRSGDDRSTSSGGGANDEGSREPEGRSQNSSPATSLIRGPTLDQWPREKKNPLDPWEQESDLKGVLRDLNSTRDQLLALQHLELDPALRINIPGRTQDLASESTASAKQEIIHLSIARQALEAEKAELKRLLDQRENIITELRKQMHHRDKTIQVQRAQFEDAIRNLQNGKRTVSMGDTALTRGNTGMGGGTREELQLVRDAIISLRSNFRGTDPNQHTLDTLEQAIAVLIERCGGLTSVGGTGGVGAGNGANGSPGSGGLANGVISTSADKSSRPGDKRLQVNGVVEPSTKVIYFTERTVTPFMSTINKRLGEIRLRDFKNMFDRPGLFRFHFKSHDPEYGMVKEEIVNDDDILPGVEGKIIAWVEEDTD